MNLFVTVYLAMLWLQYPSAEVREKASAHHDPSKMQADTPTEILCLKAAETSSNYLNIFKKRETIKENRQKCGKITVNRRSL